MIADTIVVLMSTVSRVVERVSNAIAVSMDVHVKFSRNVEETMIKFSSMRPGFAGVIGCIDGTHVRIQAPSLYENVYVNRKGYHSINVQLVCDADLKIMNAVVKKPGSAHDARILRESALFAAFEADTPPLHGHLLGDSGYMLRYCNL